MWIFSIDKTNSEKILIYLRLLMFSENNKVCYMPFYMAEISEDGNVYPCCPRFVDFFSFGNLLKNDFQEVWLSEKANLFREKILNNDYSLCNKDMCISSVFKEKELVLHQWNENRNCKFLRLAYDTVCNVACKTCRDEIKVTFSGKQEEITKKIIPLLDNVEIIQLSVAGDVFASKNGIDFIKFVTNNYPKILFEIDTNGILLTKNLYEELNLRGKIKDIRISIPGATQKTYNKIVCKGNFSAVMENLKFIAEEKKNGYISSIFINMVIAKYNYKEMAKMAKIAQKFNVNVNYTCYQPWEHTTLAKKYKELAVFEKDNPLYKDFLKHLNKKELLSDICNFEPRINPKLILQNYQNKTILYYLKKFLKQK
ncbi:MAG: hypothetical protein E7Z90_03520 [Cyanobacteria bacterium SIG29]|nr:hypothetical protein [Cyanobacteria bacterium SIG29]